MNALNETLRNARDEERRVKEDLQQRNADLERTVDELQTELVAKDRLVHRTQVRQEEAKMRAASSDLQMSIAIVYAPIGSKDCYGGVATSRRSSDDRTIFPPRATRWHVLLQVIPRAQLSLLRIPLQIYLLFNNICPTCRQGFRKRFFVVLRIQ